MYLTERRRKELDLPKTPVVTSGDLTYLITRAILNAERQIWPLYSGISNVIERFLPDSTEKCRYEDFIVLLGCLTSAQMEYERRRAWVKKDSPVPEIIKALEDIRKGCFDQYVGIYHERKLQQNGDYYLED